MSLTIISSPLPQPIIKLDIILTLLITLQVQIAAGVGNGYVRLPSLEVCLDALQEMQGVTIEGDGGDNFTLNLRRLDWA
jgi:hypothetical protein